jgi:pimeloyl-ACP methyl ester carboxylesterase
MPKVNINNTGIYYELHGQGETLLLIQGFAGGSNGWYRQVPVFRKHFQVVIFDARGIGNSDVSAEPYTVPVMEKDVIGLLDHLNISQAHVLGLSLGGLVAQSVAINHPERVARLILASTLPGTSPDYTAPEIKQTIGKTLVNLDVNQTMESILSLAFNSKMYRFFIKCLARPRFASYYGKYFKQMESVGYYNTLDYLHLIKSPTLVITGSNDRIVSPANSDLLASRIPGARLIVIKGGSHALFIEMSGRFNKEILGFLCENQS